jgi:hypothetical protein
LVLTRLTAQAESLAKHVKTFIWYLKPSNFRAASPTKPRAN